MSRGGRLFAAIIASATITTGLTACALLPGDQPAPAASPAAPATEAGFRAQCVVGTWHQTDGWQKLDVEETGPLEIRLESGGRDLTVAKDGTATAVYTVPAVWRGSNATTTLEATFSGRATIKYTAEMGKWSEVADTTGVTTNLTLNDKKDAPRTGTKDRAFDGSYVCSATELTLSAEDYRQTFTRV